MTQISLELHQAIDKVAERQMQRWFVGQQVAAGIARDVAVQRLACEVHPYIAISRETAAGASEVARRLGERLGWEVVDRELLDCMAERYRLSPAMLECVDEAKTSWPWEVFGKWLDSRVVPQSEYVAHLGPIVLLAARHGSVIFVGRGVQFLLPRELGLAVRIVAPWEQRVRRAMHQRCCSERAAATYLRQTDENRSNFVRQYFHHEATNPALYDLILDMSEMDVEGAVNRVLARCQARFPSAAHLGEPTEAKS